jgi:putative transposase
MGLFDEDADYRAWLGAFAEAHERFPVDVFAYCLMPNHFHLVLRPKEDGQLARFMRLGTLTHSMRWHRHRNNKGTGAVYQGRYRAFPVQTDRHFYTLCRYVEANALRARLVRRAEDWRWSSLAARVKNCNLLTLSEWPILQPSDWVSLVNYAESGGEFDAVRRSVVKSVPLGDDDWSKATAGPLGLSRHFSPPGPKRKPRSDP